jgi:hypothetical protein
MLWNGGPFSVILTRLKNGQTRSFSEGMQTGARGLYPYLAHEAGGEVYGSVPRDPHKAQLPGNVQDP